MVITSHGKLQNRPDLEASSSHSKYGYGEPTPLDLGCRIFISHSGRDKDFVRHLHHHLVNKVYCDERLVFFDEESLPTAEPISMENILAEARRCELGILVLTKAFFMNTPNPMLELEALTTSNVRLLPLFFRISVEKFKKMKCENEWEERWKAWLKGDEQRLGAWKHALNYVDTFSGLEKCKIGNNELDYIHKIVDQVALIVRPAVSFSEKGVCGMDRICKEVNDMYIQCASKRTSHCQTQGVSASASTVWGDDSNSSLDLVGIYGFAGLGKSTLCRGLCDFYAADFCGRVFFLDLGSVPDSSQASSQTYSSKSAFMLRMQYLLSQLGGSNNHIQSMDFCQIQNLLRNWIRMDRIFLAIDNILPDLKALEEAHFYLECKFARGSKVLITSRSSKLLEQVTSEYTKFSAVIEHIPKLRFEEARDIFVREMPNLCQISDVKDEVKECVSMCAIYPRIKLHDEHECGNKCYHPLMLKVSAASIRHCRRCNVDFKSKLRGFLQSARAVDKSDAWKTAFKMLDITYAILRENEKKVLLDLARFYKVNYSQSGWGMQIYTWIQTVHSHLDKNKLDDILLYLEDLSFIVMKNVYPQSVLRLHDLVVDFSMYKIKQANLGCRIFISHSGRDMDFVRHLHHHLVKVYRDERLVFFDEESLPSAEPISMQNILAEARGCELGILVLTKDFFMNTPNPMLELEALTSSNVRLLPLFFGISVDEFKKMKCENEWEERWKEWLKGDEQRLGAWKHALDFVHLFSGLEECKLGNNELDYIHEIVEVVALIVRPAVSFSEKGLCGMHRICKVCFSPYLVESQVLDENLLHGVLQRQCRKLLEQRCCKPEQGLVLG